jgi:hypothetical protein
MRSFISLSNMGFASSHPPSAAFDHIDTQITCAYMPIPGSRAASSIASSQHDVCLLRSPMTCYVSCLHHISHSLCAHMPIPGSRPASSIASSQHDVCLLRSVSRTRLFKGCRSRNEAIHLPLLPSPRLLNAPGSGGVGDRSGGQGTCAESAPMAAIARSQSPLPGCAGHASENASNAGQRAGERSGTGRSTLGRSGPGSPWVSAAVGPFLLLWCTTDGDVKLIGRRTCSHAPMCAPDIPVDDGGIWHSLGQSQGRVDATRLWHARRARGAAQQPHLLEVRHGR